jgi:hypothetical protein
MPLRGRMARDQPQTGPALAGSLEDRYFDSANWAAAMPADGQLFDCSAEEVRQFARAGDSDCYDVIGFRTVVAAKPVRGVLPLKTLEEAKGSWQSRKLASAVREDLLSLHKQVTHLSIDLPPQLSRAQYACSPGEINLTWPGSDGRYNRRTYLLAHPPQLWLEHSVDDGAPLLPMQSRQSNIEGIRWLPLAALIERGHFPRMQECPHLLAENPQSGCFCGFISHRWLTPDRADPNGLQAALIAWQFAGHLLEAIRVANGRGLSKARRRNPLYNHHVGIHGSDLAISS